jgi:hypothetical protein
MPSFGTTSNRLRAMPRVSRAERLDALETAIAGLSARLDQLADIVADRAPASEVDRLNQAYDHISRAFELISDRAPASEVERLDHAFNLLARAFELISDRAPASEVGRLDHAFNLLDQAFRLIVDRRPSERIVEVPWVLGKYQGEPRVLEIGYAFAEEHYLLGLIELDIPFLVGIDAAESPIPPERFSFHRIRGDILDSCIRPGSFDLILCVSTIEHIGRDNARYGLSSGGGVVSPDHSAMRAMAEWLSPSGRILLTVPFGKFEDVGWLINYDLDHLSDLIKTSELDLAELLFFGWMPGGWREVEPDELKDRGYKSVGASDAAGVALVELRKP